MQVDASLDASMDVSIASCGLDYAHFGSATGVDNDASLDASLDASQVIAPSCY